jgi:hypothetical protein
MGLVLEGNIATGGMAAPGGAKQVHPLLGRRCQAPVAWCGSATGFDSPDPRCRR